VDHGYIKGSNSFLNVFKRVEGLRNTSPVIFNYGLIVVRKVGFKIYGAFFTLVTLKKFKNISRSTFPSINSLLHLLKPFSDSRFL
jgi:hypothetical protein